MISISIHSYFCLFKFSVPTRLSADYLGSIIGKTPGFVAFWEDAIHQRSLSCRKIRPRLRKWKGIPWIIHLWREEGIMLARCLLGNNSEVAWSVHFFCDSSCVSLHIRTRPLGVIKNEDSPWTWKTLSSVLI